MNTKEITWMPGYELVEMIRSGELSAVVVAKHYLDRIQQYEPVLHAYISINEEMVLAEAKAIDEAIARGEEQGPLCGLPVSVKDLYDYSGYPTTRGSELLKDYMPVTNELFIERLKDAGAIILGKTQTSEFAMTTRTVTSIAGEAVNPWDTSRISGASSGGSGASVAAGMSPFSIGSDGGGSTRIPSHHNGVVGFFPSPGRVPEQLPELFKTASPGPMTLRVRDAAMIAQVICGQDYRDPSCIEQPSPDFLGTLEDGVEGLRIGWSADLGWIPDYEPDVTKRIHDTFSLFEQAGALIDDPDIRIPEDFMEIGTKTIMMSKDRLAVLGEMTAEKMGLLNPATRKMMGITHSGAAPTTKEGKIAALRERKNLKLWADSIFETYDLLCTPTLNIISPLRPEDPFEMPYPYQAYRETSSSAFTSFANILGLTAISIPAGFVNGMPVGLQILANRFNDELVFRAARAIEKLAPWHDMHPPQFL